MGGALKVRLQVLSAFCPQLKFWDNRTIPTQHSAVLKTLKGTCCYMTFIRAVPRGLKIPFPRVFPFSVAFMPGKEGLGSSIGQGSKPLH